MVQRNIQGNKRGSDELDAEPARTAEHVPVAGTCTATLG